MDRLKENIDKAFKKVINEISISQKKRNNKNVEDFFHKGKRGFNGIRTIAVFTAENPDSQQADRQINKKSNKSLLSSIKNSGYAYVPAIGKFGNIEHPYAVFNIALETVKNICGKYQQTSFVYSELLDDGTIHSEYWEKQNINAPYNAQTNDYIKKDESDTWDDETDAEDNFTIIGNKFKYSIPFNIFEQTNSLIMKNLIHIKERERENGNNTLTEEKILHFAMNNVGISPYLWRKATINGFYHND